MMSTSAFVILIISFAAVVSARVPFVGRFVSTERRENTQAFAEAAGLEDVTKRIFNEFLDKGNGEFLYKFSVENSDYKQELPFKLGEEKEATYNSTSFSYKFIEEGNELKFESKVLPNGRQVTHSYAFDPHGFVKTYQTNGVQAKVWFKKNSA